MSYADIGLPAVAGITAEDWANGGRNNQEDHEARLLAAAATAVIHTATLTDHTGRITALESFYGSVILGYTQASLLFGGTGSGTLLGWTWPTGTKMLLIHTGGHVRGNDWDNDSYIMIDATTGLLYGSYDGASYFGVAAGAYGGVSPTGQPIVATGNLTIGSCIVGSRYIQINYVASGGVLAYCLNIMACI